MPRNLFLESGGFDTSLRVMHDYNLFLELALKWDSFLNTLAELPYPMDGVVIKIADKDFRDSLGNTAHHPRGEIAYKYSNVKRESRLIDVEWSFGKNNLPGMSPPAFLVHLQKIR